MILPNKQDVSEQEANVVASLYQDYFNQKGFDVVFKNNPGAFWGWYRKGAPKFEKKLWHEYVITKTLFGECLRGSYTEVTIYLFVGKRVIDATYTPIFLVADLHTDENFDTIHMIRVGPGIEEELTKELVPDREIDHLIETYKLTLD